MFQWFKGYVSTTLDFVFSRKRKNDRKENINQSGLFEPSAKRSRVGDYVFQENKTSNKIWSSGVMAYRPISTKAPSNISVITVSDVSDDDSDVEILEETRKHGDLNVQNRGHSPSQRSTKNSSGIFQRKQQTIDLESHTRYANLLKEQSTARKNRSFLFPGPRYPTFARSEPRTQVRPVLSIGRSPVPISRDRSKMGVFQLETTYEQSKALLNSYLNEFGFSTRHHAPSPDSISKSHVFLREDERDELVESTSANVDLVPENVESTSECVSVAETTSSDASSVYVESRAPDIKRCTSLERLDNLYNRSPFTELNEKFETRDPSSLRLSMARRADEKAARNALATKLQVEAHIRRQERLAKQKSLEDLVRVRMRLEGLLIEEKELIEEFLDLTSDQLETVKRAVGQGKLDEVLTEGFNLRITRHDLRTLLDSEWLNDEVINFFMNLLVERGGKDGLPRVYAMNTFFYPKLVERGYNNQLSRWTRKVDIFSYDLVLVPIHLGVHWCLGVIDFRAKVISYYDSMGGANDEALFSLIGYLEAESLDKKKTQFDTSAWTLQRVTGIPRQMNGSDCGMFACRFAEYISRDAPITFTQVNMPYFRRRTIYEIVTKKLL